MGFNLSINERYDTSSITFSEDLTENYSDEVIEKAKQLKAKNGTGYSDTFYLNYAKSLILTTIVASGGEIYKNRALGCPVQDSQWAEYSYEEIIEMENNGYSIPDDVLQWAHAQQSADVIDYVVLEEGSSSDDNSSTAEVTSDNDVNSLLKTAKSCIIKSDTALEKAEIQYEEYSAKANDAKRIKKDKEDSYKKSMNEISKRTKEWKELDDKKKNGVNLTFTERLKYQSLSKMLDTTDGTLMKELQAAGGKLDEFLDSLDLMNTQVTENIQLGQQTTKAGEALSNFAKTFYFESNQTSGVVYKDMGLLTDSLYNVTDDEIQKLAIETGTALETYSDAVNSDITSDEITQLSEFAADYTTLANQTVEGAADKENDEEDQQGNDENNSGSFKGYSVSKDISYSNAILSSATTARATLELLNQQSKVASLNKTAKKNIKTLNKEMTKLNKESSSAAEKHDANMQQQEEFLMELEEIHEETLTETEQNQSKSAQNNSTGTSKKASVQTKDVSGEEQTIITEIQQLDAQDDEYMEKVKQSISKNTASNAKYAKNSKLLDSQNRDLNKRSVNLDKISEDTMFVGAGTFAKSFVTTGLGNSLVATGSALMGNITTYSEGVRLTIQGTELIQLGAKENISGTAAMVTAGVGLASSIAADDKVSEAKETVKNINAAIKESQAVIKDSGTNVQTRETVSGNTEGSAFSGQNQDVTESGTVNAQADTDTMGETAQAAEISETDTLSAASRTTTDKTAIGGTVDETADQTTNESSETEQTQEQEQSEETTDNDDTSYAISMEFSAENSISAAQTTLNATSAMNSTQNDVEKLSKTVELQTKQSENIAKNVQKETIKAEDELEDKNSAAKAVEIRLITAQGNMQNASSTDELEAAQEEISVLSAELDNEASDTGTESVDKSLVNSVKQLSAFKNNVKNLTGDTASLNSIISNQLKAAEQTVVVGAGTTAIGARDIVNGNNMIISGNALMTSQFTYSTGLAMAIKGGIKVALGTTEVSTGSIAAITGTAGIVSNNSAKSSAKDAQTANKTAQSAYKNTDKKIQESSKSLEQTQNHIQTDEDIATNEVNTETIIQQNGLAENDASSDETILAGSTASNANLSTLAETDDKADKKLTRFNTNSIIESKKKKKKVQAVSASSRG